MWLFRYFGIGFRLFWDVGFYRNVYLSNLKIVLKELFRNRDGSWSLVYIGFWGGFIDF